MEQERQAKNDQKLNSEPTDSPSSNEDDESDLHGGREAESIRVPSSVVGSGSLDRLVDTARDYARQATAENTNVAYKADWKHFARWCRLKGADPLPPSPELIGLYIAHCAAPGDGSASLTVATIERRLSGLAWQCQQRGFTLDPSRCALFDLAIQGLVLR